MKRYDHFCSYDGGGPAEEVESPEGMFVRYDDAQAEIERLTAELVRKSAAIQRLWKERDELRDEAEALRQVMPPTEAALAKLTSAAQEALECRDRFGWSPEADEALERLRTVLDDAATGG